VVRTASKAKGKTEKRRGETEKKTEEAAEQKAGKDWFVLDWLGNRERIKASYRMNNGFSTGEEDSRGHTDQLILRRQEKQRLHIPTIASGLASVVVHSCFDVIRLRL